jgi:hypothetical protein
MASAAAQHGVLLPSTFLLVDVQHSNFTKNSHPINEITFIDGVYFFT